MKPDLVLLGLKQLEPLPMASDGESRREKRLLVRPGEVAQMLSVSRATLRRWVVDGAIPRPVKVGRSVFWSQRTLETWTRLGCPSRVAFERWQAANPS